MRYWVYSAVLTLLAASSASAQEVIELDGLKSKAPNGWKIEQPTSKMRAYQIAVPKVGADKADAELVVFFFGPGGGGGVSDNIKRWKGMFDPPEGKSLEDVSKVEKMKVGDVALTYLDVKGTYLEKFPPFAPNAKTIRRENYRMFAVVFESQNGPYFIRLTGPARTMEERKSDFDGWLKNFK